MTLQRLQSLAGGRVWTGAQAKQIGLVDELGGLDKAIEIAAVKAKLKPGTYKVSVYPKAKSFVDELLSSATSETSMSERLLTKNIPWSSAVLEVNRWKKREGFLAMMPYLMEFE